MCNLQGPPHCFLKPYLRWTNSGQGCVECNSNNNNGRHDSTGPVSRPMKPQTRDAAVSLTLMALTWIGSCWQIQYISDLLVQRPQLIGRQEQ